MVDFHWFFAHLADAERVAASLSPLTSRPEVVLLRLPGQEAMSRWPPGTPIGITLATDKAIAFKQT